MLEIDEIIELSQIHGGFKQLLIDEDLNLLEQLQAVIDMKGHRLKEEIMHLKEMGEHQVNKDVLFYDSAES